MRHVEPIETGFADDRFETTYVDVDAAVNDQIELGPLTAEKALRKAKEAGGEPRVLLGRVVARYLKRPVDELDALVSLLGMARKVPEHERFGQDLEYVEETMMRRVRKLAQACQNNVEAILSDDPEWDPTAEDFGLSE